MRELRSEEGQYCGVGLTVFNLLLVCWFHCVVHLDRMCDLIETNRSDAGEGEMC